MVTVREIAREHKRWYFNQKEVAALVGLNRQQTAKFLRSAPCYCIATAKKYFLPDVVAAIEETRWTA